MVLPAVAALGADGVTLAKEHGADDWSCTYLMCTSWQPALSVTVMVI